VKRTTWFLIESFYKIHQDSIFDILKFSNLKNNFGDDSEKLDCRRIVAIVKSHSSIQVTGGK